MILKEAFGGNKIEKTTLELQETSLFGPSHKTTAQKHKEKNTKKTQKTDQKTPFCILANNPLFGVNFVFSSYALSCLQRCVQLKTL